MGCPDSIILIEHVLTRVDNPNAALVWPSQAPYIPQTGRLFRLNRSV